MPGNQVKLTVVPGGKFTPVAIVTNPGAPSGGLIVKVGCSTPKVALAELSVASSSPVALVTVVLATSDPIASRGNRWTCTVAVAPMASVPMTQLAGVAHVPLLGVALLTSVVSGNWLVRVTPLSGSAPLLTTVKVTTTSSPPEKDGEGVACAATPTFRKGIGGLCTMTDVLAESLTGATSSTVPLTVAVTRSPGVPVTEVPSTETVTATVPPEASVGMSQVSAPTEQVAPVGTGVLGIEIVCTWMCRVGPAGGSASGRCTV